MQARSKESLTAIECIKVKDLHCHSDLVKI